MKTYQDNGYVLKDVLKCLELQSWRDFQEYENHGEIRYGDYQSDLPQGVINNLN